ncbi:exonuclease, DNA polymerase III, epsilon subunit family protein [Roseobacter sp. SK209-2-6]|nr:exonuclease, DNA polymerase III, epsilon subunit family protein [Roseobacter sp. SK209-2-6]
MGTLLVFAGALWSGYQRAAEGTPLDPFVFAGLLSSFLVLGLVAGIWLLFDEHVAKPIEMLAAEMRSRAHAGVTRKMDSDAARYLGDLAPAAAGLAGELGVASLRSAESIAVETQRLEAEKQHLTALLSEIPVATALISPQHQIVLYDMQAASVLAQVAPPRLAASLFDYLEKDALIKAHDCMNATGKEVKTQVKATGRKVQFDLRLRPLGAGNGYVLVFSDVSLEIAPEESRPLVYDFDLLATQTNGLRTRPLRSLSFTVFDTETTGLLPHKDEIVQIGALRVVNGRLVNGEGFETLVNPGFDIPAASTAVHGVTTEMVRNSPMIKTAGAAFHQFCKDSVLVAHNAPFDIAFLRRHAKSSGVDWNHMVLDTVLLSAVIFGASVPHTLDALCDRLEINIPEALRHTAMGDAQATAEALLRMLPMLEARGFTTLDEVLEQTRQHGRLLEDLNPVDNHGSTWQADATT